MLRSKFRGMIMNYEKYRDLLLVFVILFIPIFSMIFYFIRLRKKYRNEALEKIYSFKEGLGSSIENYRIYTSGHPYYWTEITLEELIYRSLKTCDRGLGDFPVPVKSKFYITVDEKYIFPLKNR